MRKRPSLLAAAIVLPAALCAQPAPAPASAIDVANLQEDVRGLQQRVGDLSLRVEQLEAENAALHDQLAKGRSITPEQLAAALADLRQSLAAAVGSARDDILRQVDGKLAALQRESTAAAAAPARTTPAAAGNFSDNFPKQGTTYVVQKGDTLALIAKKNHAKFQDIVNANRLADPSRILVGQTLFIPLAAAKP